METTLLQVAAMRASAVAASMSCAPKGAVARAMRQSTTSCRSPVSKSTSAVKGTDQSCSHTAERQHALQRAQHASHTRGTYLHAAFVVRLGANHLGRLEEGELCFEQLDDARKLLLLVLSVVQRTLHCGAHTLLRRVRERSRDLVAHHVWRAGVQRKAQQPAGLSVGSQQLHHVPARGRCAARCRRRRRHDGVGVVHAVRALAGASRAPPADIRRTRMGCDVQGAPLRVACLAAVRTTRTFSGFVVPGARVGRHSLKLSVVVGARPWPARAVARACRSRFAFDGSRKHMRLRALAAPCPRLPRQAGGARSHRCCLALRTLAAARGVRCGALRPRAWRFRSPRVWSPARCVGPCVAHDAPCVLSLRERRVDPPRRPRRA